jgi:hypothetical protein
VQQQEVKTEADTDDAFLRRLQQADDLVPTGKERPRVTIAGKSYDSMAAVPIEELALCSPADYEAMRPAHRSHRSRRLRAAAKDGSLSPAHVEALQARGVLPKEL